MRPGSRLPRLPGLPESSTRQSAKPRRAPSTWRWHFTSGRTWTPPRSATRSRLPSAAELLAQGSTQLIAAPADAQSAARTLSSFFLRFVAALLDEDAPAAAGFLDGSVYLIALGSEVSRSDAEDQLAALFESVSLAGLGPSDVYDLDTLVTTKAPASLYPQHGATRGCCRCVRRPTSPSTSPSGRSSSSSTSARTSPRAYRRHRPGCPPAAWRPATAAAAIAVAPTARRSRNARP